MRLERSEWMRLDGLRVTTPARTIVDIAGELDPLRGDGANQGEALRLALRATYNPYERPITSSMISSVPAPIRLRRMSRHTRSTPYSFM